MYVYATAHIYVCIHIFTHIYEQLNIFDHKTNVKVNFYLCFREEERISLKENFPCLVNNIINEWSFDLVLNNSD